jgi:ribonuclease E
VEPAAVETAALAPVEVATRPAAARPRAPAAEPVAAAPAPVGSAPVAEAFVLPLGDLQQVAESSGLQWVNSDREKIAAAQAAMAAEPTPIRVPRERKPVVLNDASPLVLVETKKDLSQLKLPFETTGSAGSATPQP